MESQGNVATESGRSAALGSILLPLDLQPNTATRIRTALWSFFLTPIALATLIFSLDSILLWAAKGQPLSSTEGTAGLLFAALLLLFIGATATQTSVGLIVTTAWAAVFLLVSELFPKVNGWGTGTDESASEVGRAVTYMQVFGPTNWVGLPLIILIICISATLATRIARAGRRLEAGMGVSSALKRLRLDPSLLSGDAAWFAVPDVPLSKRRAHVHLIVVILDLAFTAAVWICTVAVAPTDISGVTVYGALALMTHSVEAPLLMGLALALGLLTLSTGWSTLGNLISAVFLMVLPGMLVIPSVASLAGTVATPGASVETSVALASPVVAACGLVSLCLTWGIHWVRTVQLNGDYD